jgi:hypothetical protein
VAAATNLTTIHLVLVALLVVRLQVPHLFLQRRVVMPLIPIRLLAA